jgi:hypothetical protein
MPASGWSGSVGDRPDHRDRAPARRGGQRRRLHVGHQRAVGRQAGPLGPADEVVHGGDRAGPGRQARAAQFGGEQRRGPAGHAVNIGSDDQVARAEVRTQAGPDAHDYELAERTVAHLPGRLRRSPGAIPGADHRWGIHGVAQAAPYRPGLDPQRAADERLGRRGYAICARFGVATPRDRLGHALPPNGGPGRWVPPGAGGSWGTSVASPRPSTYLPSAVRGNARR